MQLQPWLELVYRMIPGIKQAILLTDSTAESDQIIQWPKSGTIHDDVKATANLAVSQQKTITTTLSSMQGNDMAVDMVIALPLTRIASFTGALAILVNIKPSQQPVVMQLLHWSENWLLLLLNKEQSQKPVNDIERKTSFISEKFSMLWSNHSQLVFLGVLLVIAAMSMITGSYRVTAPASLEGRIQRVIVAPFDGYIANAYARAGENVTAGKVIAELDSKELVLQQQRYEAEKQEHTRQYRQALASRDKAQAHIYKSQISQAQAQLQLLEKKIHRSILKAPLDGVIIRGDLSRSLGAHVKTGDVLFEIAPLDEYRLVIKVDEKQVADVQKGLQGILNLKALPSDGLPFVVHKVSPVFEENSDGIAYRVEATMKENHPALRPGMQGIAKIEIDQRSYAWIYLHELYDALRLWFWSWLP